MDRSVAIKKLRKLLGDKLGYRVDPKAPTKEEREEAKANWKSGGLDGTLRKGNRIVARFSKSAERDACLAVIAALKGARDCLERIPEGIRGNHDALINRQLDRANAALAGIGEV